MKKIIVLLVILFIAVITGAFFLVSCSGTDAESDTEHVIASTEAQETEAQTTETQAPTEQAVKRQALKILLPVSKYKDVEKFTAAYNEDENKYMIDLVLIESLDGIDPAAYDGLIIPGGKHVHPSFYGAEVECTEHKYNPELDELELNLVEMFVNAGKPIMGVCRGCQLINVAFGGTLKQDIGMGHYHDAVRETATVESTVMRRLVGETVDTVHFHHQAVDVLGEGLIVTMVDTEDGTIEGYVHESLPIYSVQFHPDRMYVKDDPAIKETGKIFMEYFFDICQREKLKN